MFSEEMVVFSDISSLFSAFTMKEKPFPSLQSISTYKAVSFEKSGCVSRDSSYSEDISRLLKCS